MINGLSTSATFKSEMEDIIEIKNSNETNSYQVLFTTQAKPKHQVFLNGTPLIEDSSIDSGVVNAIRLWFEKRYQGKRSSRPFTNQDIAIQFLMLLMSFLKRVNLAIKQSSQQRNHCTNHKQRLL